MTQNLDNGPDNDPQNDAAWDLLLKARKVEASPFFARNVLREIRLMNDREASGWRSILSLPRLIAGAAAAAVIVAIIIISDQGASTSAPAPSIAEAPVPARKVAPATAVQPAVEVETFDIDDYEDEIEMIDYLDGLLAVQDVSALDDEALSELLF